MQVDLNKVQQQIDDILVIWKQLEFKAKYEDFSDLPDQEVSELITLMDSTIERLSPIRNRHRENARKLVDTYGVSNGRIIGNLVGILKAIKTDYSKGYLQTLQELIHAELFSDFLDMASYLLDEGYKDPAAVLIGGVLEEHLRKLCIKYGISIEENYKPKKADKINSDLSKEKVYSKLDQKSITAWLDLRNKAAHGKYDEYSKEQVLLMLEGVRNFISRNTA